MRKVTGLITVELYDEYAHKVQTEPAKGFIPALQIAKSWEEQDRRYTAVISRVLYNTNSNNDKWEYTS